MLQRGTAQSWRSLVTPQNRCPVFHLIWICVFIFVKYYYFDSSFGYILFAHFFLLIDLFITVEFFSRRIMDYLSEVMNGLGLRQIDLQLCCYCPYLGYRTICAFADPSLGFEPKARQILFCNLKQIKCSVCRFSSGYQKISYLAALDAIAHGYRSICYCCSVFY